MRKYTLYLLVFNILILAILLWVGYQRFSDFRTYHQALAKESAGSAAQEVKRFIADRKRLVALFARDYHDLIQQLMRSPNDSGLYERLDRHIKTYFPDKFSFTLTNAEGEALIEDFDGYIGDLCLDDLKQFVGHDKQMPRIHPNYEVYHFDILAPIQGEGLPGVLLISFHAELLGNTLSSAQSAGHQLMLIQPEAHLIEVTADGARNNWVREDYRMSDLEQSRILYRNAVRGTVWEVVDLNLPNLFADYRAKLFLHSVIIIITFMVISILMYVALRREEFRRKMAEQNKDEFLGVVSHELRTPITAIHGSLGLVKGGHMGQLNEDVDECVGIAIKNCERMSLLINDLLDLQKVEAGQMQFNIQQVSLKSIVSVCIDNHQGYFEKFKASIDLQCPEGDHQVNVDPMRFEQALANLLSNAVKYGAKQDTIEVKIERINDQVRVSVSDHGQGIPLSRQHLIFKRYAQLETSVQVPVKSTGLGLNIVEHMIEAQGGRVGFVSQEGHGSTFYLELPLTG